MKKYKLNPAAKWSCIALCILIGSFFAIQIYKDSSKVETVTTETPLYHYSIGVDSAYEVSLLPNSLFEDEIVGEGEVYFPKLIRAIRTTFTGEIASSHEVVIQGSYSVVLELASYVTEEREKKDLWIKAYTLVPEKAFDTRGDSYAFETTVDLDYHTYKNTIEALAEIAGANAATEMRICFNGQVVLETPYGIVEKVIDSKVIIPDTNNYFNITKVAGDKLEDTIKDTQITTVAVKNTRLLPMSIGILMSVIGVIILIIMTEAPTSEDIKKKKIQALFQQHGSRMVAIDQMDLARYITLYQVKSLDDLVKIADELEKPVLYCKDMADELAIAFYTIDHEIIYRYNTAEEKSTT